MIKFDKDICSDFDSASKREWLETNGIGGFASGTISGANTRRYHGILTAAIKPPLGRITILSKFEETFVIDGTVYELSANQFPGTVSPQGYQYLKSFQVNPFPVWTYEIQGITLQKKLFMVYGENTTVCCWSLSMPKKSAQKYQQLELKLLPLLSFADYHSLQHESPDIRTRYETVDQNTLAVKLNNDEPTLYLHHNAKSISDTGYWYRNFEYSIEKERGFDFHEDLFQPFAMNFDLSSPAYVTATTNEEPGNSPKESEMEELFRRETIVAGVAKASPFKQQLLLAADQFIVSRGEGKTIIAGYPWFSDWGRDTMISLPGIALAANRPEIAKNILLEYSKHISQGMIPNRFPDVGEEADYNTVDATLWYFEAVRHYIAATEDSDFIRENIYEKLVDIIYWHLRGTRFNIHVDTDGLLYAGNPDVQLTWMDAKIGDLVITPRTGKPVEIQALWFNALKIMGSLAESFGDAKDSIRYNAMADLCKLSFNAVFWNEDEQCLFDVINNDERDGSVRPNQIFAASLFYTVLDNEHARAVVKKVENELLTPFGLRSLSPKDKNYCPVYIGTPFERDSSYHQGTVWGWLIGAYVDAFRRVNAESKDVEKSVTQLLSAFEKHLTEAGIGQISEIFDGDAPHLPRGCFAQAWSVGEVLRILHE